MKAVVLRVALMAAATAAAFASGALAVSRHLLVPAILLIVSAGSAFAGDPPPGAPAKSEQTAQAEADEDMEIKPAEPDFWLVNQPTPLRLPKYGFGFRVTHRFLRSLNQGDFGDALSDAFGLDAGAQIGMELRFAPFSGAQVAVYRTSDKTIQFYGTYSVLQQRNTVPIGLAAVASVEGTGNFTDSYSPAIGASVSRTFGEVLAVYAVPMWVNNSNPEPEDAGVENDTFVLGLGARVHFGRGLYVVVESSPRLSGFKGGGGEAPLNDQPGRTLTTFAIEKRVGGHVFQINFSNGVASTPANIARGAPSGDTNWYLGFNITRKFY